LNLLEENTGETLADLDIGKNFLERTPQLRRHRTDKWNCIRLQSFCIAREIVNRAKDSLGNGEDSLPAIHLTGD
jgi:hypothetical protein